ncbi:MAG: hypothetical protein A3K04_06810 [Gallionellales bacterium RBG_16_56_9]|nr:MAG: hypothetical protein A3K04_06810 [Gallionellales bacterium RBG_16_56_9]
MYARPFIDSLDFARNSREISGEVPVAEMPRLLDVLENPQGMLSYTVRGGLDKQGNPLLDAGIVGCCQLRCQRCLNGLDYAVQLDTRLLLRDQASLDALDDAEEEFDSILAEAHLDVLNLLEEEILLSLPIAPKHELGACQAADGENAPKAGNSLSSCELEKLTPHQDEQHPFAVLAKLKRN